MRDEIYVRTRPLQWALNNVPGEATFETWITLQGPVAHVRCRLVNMRTDTTEQFGARHQELPAVYTRWGGCTGCLRTRGRCRFQDAGGNRAALRRAPPWQYWRATENWAAMLDDNGWGLGVFIIPTRHVFARRIPWNARFRTIRTTIQTGYISPHSNGGTRSRYRVRVRIRSDRRFARPDSPVGVRLTVRTTRPDYRFTT